MEKLKPEKIVERVSNHPGVEAVILCDKDGGPVHTTTDNTQTVLYVEQVKHITNSAKNLVRELDPTDECAFVTVTTSKYDILSKSDKKCLVLVIQSLQKKDEAKKNEFAK